MSSFVCRIEFPDLRDTKPGRLYVHRTGCQLFQNEDGYEPAANYALDMLGENPELFKPADFVIPVLWGEAWGGEEANVMVAEIFGYGDMREWPGNPTVYNWVFKNGLHIPEERQISCGDTMILLGAEETYRRNTRDLKEYISKAPQLPEELLIR
jgi:hypothetical protein